MMKLNSVALATLALMSGLAMNAEAAARDGSKVYIIQMKEEPAATYQGTTDGYAATQAPAGSSYHSRTRASVAYTTYLRSKQVNLLASVSSTPVISQFDTIINGFTARLTPAQAAALSVDPSVAMVAEDQILHPDTITTPTFLGLTVPGGLWSQLDPTGVAVKGEGMILGDVDLGIWPESPSYADHVDVNNVPTFTGGTLAYTAPPSTWSGTCVAGDSFVPAQACNNKLIGARYYNTNLLTGGNTLDWTSFNSPRDDLPSLGGHGDHTASTAAGNSQVAVTLNGLAFGIASGMAPRARIAAYKVCFSYVTPTNSVAVNQCSSADSMAAIDQAVKDGVNAINFSISGATSTTNDIVEQAFYRAAVAGVFVAAAAGNSGPADTVNHPGPWLSTIAAATHDRVEDGDVTLASGSKYTGASLNASGLPLTTLIRGEDAGTGGADASLCFTSDDVSQYGGQVVLDPAKVAGKVVICTRGTNARVNKSLAVANAGGVGMILVDNGAGLVSEVHSVPTVHVSATDGAAIKAYALSGGTSAKAAETAFYFGKQAAPTIASFSGRGPNLADVNVLKPDMAAPGVGVVASVTPALTQTQRNMLAAGTLAVGPAWASYDGTSMATPHVTGVSLLLKQAHPTWTPSAIKSALMTTAFDTLDDGLTGLQNGKLPWSQGAGFINPQKATDPGLVYDMTKGDYVAYQCLTQKPLIAAADCTTYGTLDQTYNLNLPSITLGAMTGAPITVKRTVTNVGTASATYLSTATLSNMSVAVTPTSLTLAPGAKGSFTVTVTPTAATPKFAWQYGSLSWSDGSHVVRSPLQAYLGSSIAAPVENSTAYTSVAGSRLFTIQTGVAGTPAATKGMAAATLGPATRLTPNTTIDVAAVCAGTAATTTSVAVYSMTVPTGTIVARFALRQADVSGAADDNDLAVVAPNGAVTASESSTSHETVELLTPAAGTYKVCVSSYAAATGASTHRLSSWIVKPGDAVAGTAFNVLLPRTVYSGGTATVGMSWSGLSTSQRYVGAAAFLDATGSPVAATPTYIDTTPGIPADLPTTTADSKRSLMH